MTMFLAFFAGLGATARFCLAALLVALIAGAGGYVWGLAHGKAEVSAMLGQQEAALAKSYQSTIGGYDARLKAADASAAVMAGDLAQARASATQQVRLSIKKVSDAVPQNSDCDLSPAALDLLRGQPARH